MNLLGAMADVVRGRWPARRRGAWEKLMCEAMVRSRGRVEKSATMTRKHRKKRRKGRRRRDDLPPRGARVKVWLCERKVT